MWLFCMSHCTSVCVHDCECLPAFFGIQLFPLFTTKIFCMYESDLVCSHKFHVDLFTHYSVQKNVPEGNPAVIHDVRSQKDLPVMHPGLFD